MNLIKSIQIDKENYHFIWQQDEEIYHTFYLPMVQILMEHDKASHRIIEGELRDMLKVKTKQALLDTWKGFLSIDEIIHTEGKTTIPKANEPYNPKHYLKYNKKAGERKARKDQARTLYRDGADFDEIAELTKTSPVWLTRWINEFKKEGVKL